MTSISPARLALAVLLAGLATGEADAQPTPTKPQPAKPSGDDAPATGEANESAALAEARSLFIEGNAHYSAGRYALAAERFIKAYELSGKPALLFNLANTYERVGDYEKAAKYLRMYLDGGDVHDTGSVKARLQRLELAVVELQNSHGGDTAGAPPPSTPVANAASDKPPAVDRRASRAPYFVAGGGVVLGAAAAVTFGILAKRERSEIDGLCMDRGSGVICPPEAASHLDNERRNALISDIGIGVAAASLATGVIYYLVTRDKGPADEPSRQALSITPSATGDGFGVVAAGRF